MKNENQKIREDEFPDKMVILEQNELIEGNSSYDLQNDIIDACKQGDPKAQFQFYKLNYKSMYDISLNIVNDPHEAEDIMQESFMIAFEKIGFFSGASSFMTWFKIFITNRSNDWSRNKCNLQISL
jgi:DNA-directed RNA polymerase specialized sigma24 family protein